MVRSVINPYGAIFENSVFNKAREGCVAQYAAVLLMMVEAAGPYAAQLGVPPEGYVYLHRHACVTVQANCLKFHGPPVCEFALITHELRVLIERAKAMGGEARAAADRSGGAALADKIVTEIVPQIPPALPGGFCGFKCPWQAGNHKSGASKALHLSSFELQTYQNHYVKEHMGISCKAGTIPCRLGCGMFFTTNNNVNLHIRSRKCPKATDDDVKAATNLKKGPKSKSAKGNKAGDKRKKEESDDESVDGPVIDAADAANRKNNDRRKRRRQSGAGEEASVDAREVEEFDVQLSGRHSRRSSVSSAAASSVAATAAAVSSEEDPDDHEGSWGYDEAGLPRWCSCQGLDEGAMVQCWNKRQCPHGRWFHFVCLGWRKNHKPPDKWLCPDCQADEEADDEADEE